MNYNPPKSIVSMKEAKNRLTELARRVEQGETIIVTRNGKPVFEMTQPKMKKGGVDLEAGWAYLRSIGVTDPFPCVAENFDDPLPEDFLITPLPPEFK